MGLAELLEKLARAQGGVEVAVGPFAQALERIETEDCLAGRCGSARAARETGVRRNVLVHTSTKGQRHAAVWTAADTLEQIAGCNSVLEDGSRPAKGSGACPKCGEPLSNLNCVLQAERRSRVRA